MDYTVVIGRRLSESAKNEAYRLRDALGNLCGEKPEIVGDGNPAEETAHEILFGSESRADGKAVLDTLKEDEYAIRVVEGEGGKTSVVLAYNGSFARMAVLDRFLDEFVNGKTTVAIPRDTDIRGKCTESDALITSSIPSLRDPCVLVADDGTYYAYGTGWIYYKNTSGSLAGAWEGPFNCVEKPADANADYWAPEVHRYGGAYYMLTTYHSAASGHRGCAVFRSESPEGPFVMVSDGHVTPRDWDAIDGTLYIDEDGQPWMVFVHEWTSLANGVGRMAAAKLSEDLTHFVSEPIELFNAKSPSWSANNITDGCWVRRLSDGTLLMIWSNWDANGYCVGMARSKNGKIDGEWEQLSRRLYSKGITGTYDGGHGMIFTDRDGRSYLAFHSPNDASAGRNCIPVFLPVKEENHALVWDLD